MIRGPDCISRVRTEARKDAGSSGEFFLFGGGLEGAQEKGKEKQDI